MPPGCASFSGGACERDSISSQSLEQTEVSSAREEVLTFRNADLITNEQVASNGTLELTELGGTEMSPANAHTPPFHPTHLTKPTFIFAEFFLLPTVLYGKDFQFSVIYLFEWLVTG